ncbi:MAG TPA: leucine--tRNA ligase, partial [Candidatus Latescibacteria bacterium]|nr:leucine--tRNA ligase [Candidatus Latescibacterota bacterium]
MTETRWTSSCFRHRIFSEEDMNAEKFDHQAIEKKWAERWIAEKTFEPDIEHAEKPYYNLMMFPYPSAEGLHVGNVFAFVGSDLHARFMRAQGYDVFEPMGFDAFGIHSENFAISINTHPGRLIPDNIRNFTHQLKRTGNMYDWSHAVETTDPAYYKWTQWIFIQLFKAGLAYQKEAPVTWCPSCNTVLAAEQAEDGACERCGTLVEQRNMRQWFFKITAYAQQLLDNLAGIDWSEKTKSAQRRWIGRSEGAEVDFPLAAYAEKLRVFTTRPDTLWGATYMVLAPEHALVEAITTPDRQQAVQDYILEAGRKTAIEREDATREKTGVFTGAYAINPVNEKQIPIWVSDYVLMTYGTGAIMAVPAHDARDLEFAQKFELPIRVVVEAPEGESLGFVGDGVSVESGFISGLPTSEAKAKIIEWLEEKGQGKRTINFKLRDWLFSRQRYWGEPFPIVWRDGQHEAVAENDLPVLPPELDDYKPTAAGDPPLARAADWVNLPDGATRETNTMPQWAGSCWYYLRYLDSQNDEHFVGKSAENYWMNVDLYVGGTEHAV